MNQTAISKLHLQTGCQNLEFHKWRSQPGNKNASDTCCMLKKKHSPSSRNENSAGSSRWLYSGKPSRLDGWWFFTNPFEKYAEVKLDPFPQVKVENTNN